MAKIRITGSPFPGLDGEHELDISRFMHGELREVKRETGLLGVEFEKAIEVYDTDAVVALAWIALNRKGIAPSTWAPLWAIDVGNIVADFTEDNEEAQAEVEKLIPPVSTPTSEPSGSAAGETTTNETEHGSGAPTSNGSANPDATPSPTGPPPSDTGAPSVLATSPDFPPSS